MSLPSPLSLVSAIEMQLYMLDATTEEEINIKMFWPQRGNQSGSDF
jgi:hypothetical protein